MICLLTRLSILKSGPNLEIAFGYAVFMRNIKCRMYSRFALPSPAPLQLIQMTTY